MCTRTVWLWRMLSLLGYFSRRKKSENHIWHVVQAEASHVKLTARDGVSHTCSHKLTDSSLWEPVFCETLTTCPLARCGFIKHPPNFRKSGISLKHWLFLIHNGLIKQHEQTLMVPVNVWKWPNSDVTITHPLHQETKNLNKKNYINYLERKSVYPETLDLSFNHTKFVQALISDYTKAEAEVSLEPAFFKFISLNSINMYCLYETLKRYVTFIFHKKKLIDPLLSKYKDSSPKDTSLSVKVFFFMCHSEDDDKGHGRVLKETNRV